MICCDIFILQNQSDVEMKDYDLILLDIDRNHLLMNNLQVNMKLFNNDAVDECIDYMTSEITDIYLYPVILVIRFFH